MGRSLRWTFTCMLLGAGLARPQTELTLTQAVDLAIERNRMLEIAKGEVRKSQLAIGIARSYRLPQFNVTSTQGYLLQPLEFILPPGSIVAGGSYGLFNVNPIPAAPTPITTPRQWFNLTATSAVQPISQQFKIGQAIEASKLNQQIATQKRDLEEQKVVNEVKRTYYSLVQVQGALDALEDTVTLFQEVNRVAANALEQEAILKADRLDATLALAQAELERTKLRNNQATLREQMNSLLGREIGMEFRVTSRSTKESWDLDLAATRARALDQRPEIKEAELKVRLAETDQKAKRSELFPDVTARVDYIAIRNVSFVPRNIAAASVVLQWDVFDWRRKRRDLAVKEETIQQAKTAVSETKSQIEVEVGLNYRKLQEALQQMEVASLSLAAEQEKLRVALNKYEQQALLLKDVMQLRASVSEKTYKYQEASLAFWSARADLEKASGQR